jgi:chromosome segregation ATPase
MQEGIGQAKETMAAQEKDLADRRTEIETLEAELRQRQQDLAALTGKLAVCEELLNPAQDSSNGLRQSLDTLAAGVTKIQEFNDYQLQAIAELRQTVMTAVNSVAQPMAAS